MLASPPEVRARNSRDAQPSLRFTSASRHQPSPDIEAPRRADRRAALTLTGLTAEVRKVLGEGDVGPNLVSPIWRLIVILEAVGGRFSLVEPGRSKRIAADPQNAMFLIPPNLSLEPRAEGLRFVRYLDLQFQPALLSPLFRDGQAPPIPDQARLGFFDDRVFGLARLFEWECQRERADLATFGDSLSVSLLTALAGLPDLAPAEPTSGGLTPWQLRRAMAYLEEKLAESVRPDDLAAMFGFSRSHFCRAFKATTGMPPHAWQLAKRIERAQELIIEGRQSLVDIALATGFTDQPHFTRAFTRAVGSPPGLWRRRLASLAA